VEDKHGALLVGERVEDFVQRPEALVAGRHVEGRFELGRQGLVRRGELVAEVGRERAARRCMSVTLTVTR
jgi:hypothetical protein